MTRGSWKSSLRFVTFAATSVGGLTLAAAPAEAQAAPLACGSVVSASVTLSRDLDCGAGAALRITGTGTVVNLSGHTIRSTKPCTMGPDTCPIVIDRAAQGVRLRSGTLAGAGVGMWASGSVLASLRVSRAEMWVAGADSRLIDSTVSDGTVYVAASGTRVERNVVNRGRGIRVFDTFSAVRDFRITDNTVLRSSGEGIAVPAFLTIDNDISGQVTQNVVSGSRAAGIRVVGQLQALGPVDLSSNVVVANAGDGLVVEPNQVVAGGPPGGPVRLADNVALDNGGRGIRARWLPNRPSRVVDGGGNRAAGNATVPQCVGVAC